VVPLGPHRYRLEPDQTYLRLRSILRKKQKQLPKGVSGIILLEISDLAKLMVDEFTLSAALYGDLQMRVRAEPGFPQDLHRKPNGFFMGTTRVSAVAIEQSNIDPDRVSVSREVFPTNNPQPKVLTLEELKLLERSRQVSITCARKNCDLAFTLQLPGKRLPHGCESSGRCRAGRTCLLGLESC
jgi:hypothetical protein